YPTRKTVGGNPVSSENRKKIEEDRGRRGQKSPASPWISEHLVLDAGAAMKNVGQRQAQNHSRRIIVIVEGQSSGKKRPGKVTDAIDHEDQDRIAAATDQPIPAASHQRQH